MASPRAPAARWARLCTAGSFAVLTTYFIRWLGMDRHQIAQSDFAPPDAAAILWRTGQGSKLYDPRAEAHIYSRLVAGDHQGLLLFNHAPLTAVIRVPFSLPSVNAGYRLAGMVELLFLVLAVMVTVRVAPWPRKNRGMSVAIGALALAGLPTLITVLETQELGLITLGLALFYWGLRSRRPVMAGCILAVAACLGKPHLFVGIGVWLIGRRQGRELVGAGLGVAVSALLTLLLFGPGIFGSFWHVVIGSSTAKGNGTYGVAALWNAWFGSSAAATAGSLATGLVVLGAALYAGIRSRKGDTEPWLAVAVLASLIVSPHVNAHDFVLLVPAVVWLGAWCVPRMGLASGVVPWIGLNLAIGLDYSNPSRLLGSFTALVSLAILAWAIVALSRWPDPVPLSSV